MRGVRSRDPDPASGVRAERAVFGLPRTLGEGGNARARNASRTNRPALCPAAGGAGRDGGGPAGKWAASVKLRGRPKRLRVDDGPEFAWAHARPVGLTGTGVAIDFSRAGEPTDDASIASFNGRRRAECLNASWFLSLAECPRGHRGLEVQRQRRSTPHGPGRLDAPSLRYPSCRSPRTGIGRGPQTGSSPRPTMPDLRTRATGWGNPIEMAGLEVGFLPVRFCNVEQQKRTFGRTSRDQAARTVARKAGDLCG